MKQEVVIKLKKGDIIEKIWTKKVCKLLSKDDPNRWLKNLKITFEVLK